MANLPLEVNILNQVSPHEYASVSNFWASVAEPSVDHHGDQHAVCRAGLNVHGS